MSLLLDRYLHTKINREFYKRGVVDAVVKAAISAKRFFFDQRAVEHLATTIRNAPELIADNQQFAIAPYPVMYVEFNFPHFYETLTGRTTDPSGDAVVGYLFDRNTVYVLAGGNEAELTDRRLPSLIPLAYHLNSSWEVQDQLDFCNEVKTSRMQLDSFTWGETYLELDEIRRRSLRDNHSCSLLLSSDKRLIRAWDILVNSSSGDLRNILIILLLMNSPKIIEYVSSVPKSKHFKKGKLRQYMDYNVVSININPVDELRRIGGSSDRSTPRAHGVKGHYCYNASARAGSIAGCQHHWIEFADKESNWLCANCNGVKWFRRDHMRGDASLGYVDKDYVITAS